MDVKNFNIKLKHHNNNTTNTWVLSVVVVCKNTTTSKWMTKGVSQLSANNNYHIFDGNITNYNSINFTIFDYM